MLFVKFKWAVWSPGGLPEMNQVKTQLITSEGVMKGGFIKMYILML